MELQVPEHPGAPRAPEGFVKRARSMRRQIIQRHANKIGTWVVDMDQVAHALRKVGRRAMIGDRHMTPRFVCVQKHKQIRSAIAPGLAIMPFRAP